MTRNPNWTRDELILALDLYFRVNPRHTSESHPEIVALSELLNHLPIHLRTAMHERFRNPNAVYMKLCNFLRLDPTYEGRGLQAGSRLEEIVWTEFASDRELLRQTADAIRNSYASLTAPTTREDMEEVYADEEFPEGRILTRAHRQRERNRSLVARKKRQVVEATGKLLCEVCGFDFEAFYGEIGHGFAECHHNIPLGELSGIRKTKLSELSIVCANCHCILHRTRPWMSVAELRDSLKNRGII